MSQDRRPSQVQPPVSAITASSDMTLVQNAPTLPAMNGHSGHGEPHSSDRLNLPPILEPSPRAVLDTALPPMKLPPPDFSRSHASTNALSITSLLSRNPESPRGLKRQHHPHNQPPSARPYPSSNSSSVSPGELQAHIPPRQPVGPHYIDAPPRQLHSPAHFAHAEQPQQRHLQRWRPPSSGSRERDTSQPSPVANKFPFSRGNQPSSSEHSPHTSVPTAPPFPIQPKAVQSPPLDYVLTVRQQPAAARACGFGERDRRVIDPPPILELKITDRETGRPESDPDSYLALHCTLLNHDGSDDETEAPPTQEGMNSTRRLMGTLVASPYPAKDENGVAGTFFVFPDLSCRSTGKYRLRFKLLRIDFRMMTPGATHGSVASITSDIFSVYTAKDFPGMRASSALLKSLRRQGLNVGVKRGSEARKKGKAKKASSSDEDDSDLGRDDDNDGNVSDETASTAAMSPKTRDRKKRKKPRQGA